MEFTDAVAIGNTRTTRDGYLVVDARVARIGIQLYRGYEIGRDKMPVVKVYRPEDEVFAHDSMGSYAFKPVTNDHPPELVNADNWHDYSVGIIGDTVARDGEHVRVPFTMMDGGAIKDVQDGKRELSAGYTADIDWTPGQTPDGQAYDAVQRNIRINHLAVVDAGRAGPECRIGDSWSTPNKPMRTNPDMPDNLRTVQVDGISVQVTDQAIEVITKLQKQLADATTAASAKDAQITALRDAHTAELDGLKKTHQSALDALKGETDAKIADAAKKVQELEAEQTKKVEGKDGEIAALKAQIPDAAALDTLLVARAAVIDAAKKVLGDKFDFAGKTNADIRRAVVQKRLGDAAVADKSDDYIQAAFDTLTVVGGQQQSDPVRDALRGAPARSAPADVSDAHKAYVDSLQNGWKRPDAGAKE